MELVSRGKKDAYFIQGAQRTWFGADYSRRSPHTREIRLQNPENPVQFGHWFDVELPRTGDMLMSADLRIQMPTWLPPSVAAINRSSVVVELETQTPDVWARFGWTNGVANYLVRRWALYADNLMLTEGWGEFNSWFPDMETTQMHAPIIHATTGIHDGTDRNIQKNATLPELVFRVPLIGCQKDKDVGLPLCALTAQRLYLRFWLAGAADMVESGLLPGMLGELPLYEVCPRPWGRRIRVDGVIVPERTLAEHVMGQPYVYGRFAVLNLDEEVRRELAATSHTIVFREQKREDFIIPDLDWMPGARIHRRLDIRGFFQALFLGFISEARQLQNKYRSIDPPGTSGEWLQELGLVVNAEERIRFWPPKKFQELANNTQLRRDVEVALYYLIFGVNPDEEPAGTCNLTRTQKTILTLVLADIPLDPAVPTRNTGASLVGLSWNLFDVAEGVGRLRYAD